MPRVAKLKNGASIYVYADDHAPPHFHLLSASSDVQVRLDNLQVMQGSYSKRELAEALRWAAQNRDLLTAKWSEYNERD